MAFEHAAEDEAGDDRHPRHRHEFHRRDLVGAGCAHLWRHLSAVIGQHHAQLGTRRPERIPCRIVVRRDAVALRGQVHALETHRRGLARFAGGSLDVPHRQLRETDVAVRLDRHEVAQPTVVDLVAARGDLGIFGRKGALARARQQMLPKGEWLAVLAAMEDHSGGDTVVVHVAKSSVDVVVAFGLEVALARRRSLFGLDARHREARARARPNDPIGSTFAAVYASNSSRYLAGQ